MPFVRGGHFTPSRKDDITNKVQPENGTIPEAGYKTAYSEIHILKLERFDHLYCAFSLTRLIYRAAEQNQLMKSLNE